MLVPTRFLKNEQEDLHLEMNYLLSHIYLCIVYFYAGLGKALGMNWFDGNAVWYVINGFTSASTIENAIPLINYPIVFKIICWGTIALELLYPILIFTKKTRKIALYLVLLMHLSIGVFMEFYTFGLIMILINLIAFGHYINWSLPKLKNYFVLKTNTA